MRQFRLGCFVTVSAYTVLHAGTLEQAITIAQMRETVISTGHDGADSGRQWVIDDADGSATNIHESGA